MALIRTRVYRDAIGAERDALFSVLQKIRKVALARIAQQSNFVDVNAEGDHGKLQALW